MPSSALRLGPRPLRRPPCAPAPRARSAHSKPSPSTTTCADQFPRATRASNLESLLRLPDRLALLQKRANPFLRVLARTHHPRHLHDVLVPRVVRFVERAAQALLHDAQ